MSVLQYYNCNGFVELNNFIFQYFHTPQEPGRCLCFMVALIINVDVHDSLYMLRLAQFQVYHFKY